MVGRCTESSDVGHDAATHAHDDVITREARFDELRAQPLDGREALRRFPTLDGADHGGSIDHEVVNPTSIDHGLLGDDGDLLGRTASQLTEHLAYVVAHAIAHGDVVGIVLEEHGNGQHDASTVAQIAATVAARSRSSTSTTAVATSS